MSAVNAGQLLILVWTFTAVCQADDNHISVSCADVSGTVGEEVTLNCSVSLSQECSKRCITLYKFQYLESHNDSEICRQVPLGCEQRNSFPCRFTPNTNTTEQIRFFVQTQCGERKTEFTANITETSSTKEAGTGDDPGYNNSVIAAVTGCFFIILIIIMTIIYKMKPNYTKLCGFQRRMFLGHRHDEDNSDSPEDMS